MVSHRFRELGGGGGGGVGGGVGGENSGKYRFMKEKIRSKEVVSVFSAIVRCFNI